MLVIKATVVAVVFKIGWRSMVHNSFQCKLITVWSLDFED